LRHRLAANAAATVRRDYAMAPAAQHLCGVLTLLERTPSSRTHRLAGASGSIVTASSPIGTPSSQPPSGRDAAA
jgi:hypothetical protein